MDTCETCKFWLPPSRDGLPDFIPRDPYGLCRHFMNDTFGYERIGRYRKPLQPVAEYSCDEHQPKVQP